MYVASKEPDLAKVWSSLIKTKIKYADLSCFNILTCSRHKPLPQQILDGDQIRRGGPTGDDCAAH